MDLINLTPHVISVRDENGAELLRLAPSGAVARVAEVRVPNGTIDADGVAVPVSLVRWGEVIGLPDYQPDVAYVVSAMVAAACGVRSDVFSPGPLVRGADGQPVGCLGLTGPAGFTPAKEDR